MELKDGKLVVDVVECLEELQGDSLVDLINYLSINDEVLERVAQQLVFGWTDDGWKASTNCYAGSTYPTPLEKWRRQIVMGADNVAADEIQRLQSTVDSQRREIERLYERIRQSANEFVHY